MWSREECAIREIFITYCKDIFGWQNARDASNADSDINPLICNRNNYLTWPVAKEGGVCVGGYFYPAKKFSTAESAKTWLKQRKKEKPAEPEMS